MMGAGKTTVGKLLAKQLGKTFIDSDEEIQRRTGVTIPHIFDVEGEAGFRVRESGVIQELLKQDDIVLATGGGAILSAQNRPLMKQNGVVVYLKSSVHDLWQRTRHDHNRPLLQTSNPRAKLQELVAEVLEDHDQPFQTIRQKHRQPQPRKRSSAHGKQP